MEIERHDEITLYKFNWYEHMLVNSALKYIDRRRRQGVSDSLPIHSAMRAVSFEDTSETEAEYPVHWIIEDREEIGAVNDKNILDPSPEVLAEVMKHASNEIASGDHFACIHPIGRIAFSRYGISTEAKHIDRPLAAFDSDVQLIADIMSRS